MVSESPTQRPQVPYDTGVSVFPRSSGLAEKVKARGSPPSLKRLTATTPLASRSQRYSTSSDDADTSSGTRLVPVGSAASDGRHAEAPMGYWGSTSGVVFRQFRVFGTHHWSRR